MSTRDKMKRVLFGVLLLWVAISATGCDATVGVGVGVAYPGPWYGPWGGGVYVGGPVYYH